LLIDKRRAEGFLGGLWELPGGKKQKNETFKQAIEREVCEETGLCVNILKKLCVVKHVYSHFAVMLHTYQCELVCGDARPRECEQIKWVRPGDLHRYAFPSGTMKIFQHLKKKKYL
jgi:mutator protein MutT